SARTTVFANNIVGAVTQVRSGSYTLTAGSLPSGGSPNAFGPHIAFDSPYLYSGGNLSILIRHNGATGSNISTDAVTLASGPASGYGVRFGATWGSGYTSTGSSNGNFAIIDLSVVPAPASGALLGLALLGAARRRR
ncbi:MAG: PEP-CTERM sorting domain-containing protein, partial [Phycisphaerales bacterium]|nr:PEP-CTERM sorting domain-containing protein [Phycisphaerales bacterium]